MSHPTGIRGNTSPLNFPVEQVHRVAVILYIQHSTKSTKVAMDKVNLPTRPKPSAKPGKKPGKQPKKDISATDDLAIVHDPNFMFKTGFLAEVYRERPISDQLPRILTRFPPEPNVSTNNN